MARLIGGERKPVQARSCLEIQTPPPPYDEMPTINVIVTGECQQGKSTLIRQLAHYCDMPNLAIRIGDGNTSCTRDVGNYEMTGALQGYVLVDHNNKRLQKMSLSDLVDLDHSEAKIAPLIDDAPSYKFRFIDTPGLNDTHGEDITIMNKILGRAADLGHINALIYVRSVNEPFGSSFKTFFRYIQTSMPSLCNGLLVAHSCYTVDRMEEFLNENQRLDKIREEAFHAATNLELQHFFMDNSPDPSSPFAMTQSLNEIYRLLSHLSSQKPLPVQSMKLLKTESMRQLDAQVVTSLRMLSRRLDKEWNLAKGNATILRANAMAAHREVERLTSRIDAKETQIADLNTNLEILLTHRGCVEHYSFIDDLLFQGKLRLGTREIVYDSNHILSSVTKSCSAGTTWLNEIWHGTSWRAELSGGIFSHINGTATFYTTSRIKHSKEIVSLEASLSEMKDALNAQREHLDRNQGAEGPEGNAVQLSERITKIEEIVDKIDKDVFEFVLWPPLKEFYKEFQMKGKADVRGYADVFDHDLAKLL